MAEKLKLLNFKATEAEIAAWDACANRTVHRNRSRWIRDLLNNAASPTVSFSTTTTTNAAKPGVTEAAGKAKSLFDRAIETSAKNAKCERRLPSGTFCKACGRIHG